ncbi:hypothetical protein [Medusavirus stheno T3]|uniref:F-box domain-containing protein n=1 Tax=Medusavirus stheno T3 TaxID=3069717 RepID=A0A7S7YEI4_9VIRU|nr:hypothetical protein QKU73_gp104 [Acanthamoeba castellanii medusavirus]QPB44285.1 hypothetical protein [Medusavirus stheno T3]
MATFPILDLPCEMVLHIVDRVRIVDLPALARTCSALRDAVVGDGTLDIAIGLSRYTTARRTDWSFDHAAAKRCLQRATLAGLRSMLRLREFEPRRPMPVGRFNVVLCDDDSRSRRDTMRRVVDAVVDFSKYGIIQQLSPDAQRSGCAMMPELYVSTYVTPGHLVSQLETIEERAVSIVGKTKLVIVDGLVGSVSLRYERALAMINTWFLTGECDVILGVIQEPSPERLQQSHCQLADFVCTVGKHGVAVNRAAPKREEETSDYIPYLEPMRRWDKAFTKNRCS